MTIQFTVCSVCETVKPKNRTQKPTSKTVTICTGIYIHINSGNDVFEIDFIIFCKIMGIAKAT